jgi:hypothetical protein|tara:strand:+ start:540 stop:1202 length:663 start_codon:yes stop_codon:yes gene_type:complete
MKIHRVVTMLGATKETGKLASDMYDLNHKTYYSEREGRHLPISHMDFQHLIRAFVKSCEQEEMLDRSKHMGRVRDQAKFYDNVVENNDRIYKKRLQEQEDKLLALTTKVENLQGMLKERDELLEQSENLAHRESKHLEYWRKLYYDTVKVKGCGYVFSEISNDTDGQEFVNNMKKYLNKDSYKMRVRGQHIKPNLRGTGATYWGQSIDESTHMRVYIDKK